MSERINNIVEDIKEQYLEDDNNIPWIIGFNISIYNRLLLNIL